VAVQHIILRCGWLLVASVAQGSHHERNRLPVEYCSGPSSAVLLPLFIHAGAAGATEVCEVKKRKSREKAIGHAKY